MYIVYNCLLQLFAFNVFTLFSMLRTSADLHKILRIVVELSNINSLLLLTKPAQLSIMFVYMCLC